jgi:hypothetical protein
MRAHADSISEGMGRWCCGLPYRYSRKLSVAELDELRAWSAKLRAFTLLALTPAAALLAAAASTRGYYHGLFLLLTIGAGALGLIPIAAGSWPWPARRSGKLDFYGGLLIPAAAEGALFAASVASARAGQAFEVGVLADHGVIWSINGARAKGLFPRRVRTAVVADPPGPGAS